MVLVLRQALLRRVDRHRPRQFCLRCRRGTPPKRARPLRPRRLLRALTRALLSATRNLHALSREKPRTLEMSYEAETVTLQEEVPMLRRRK